jgi:hypothetical protein
MWVVVSVYAWSHNLSVVWINPPHRTTAPTSGKEAEMKKLTKRIATGLRATTVANPALEGLNRYAGAPSGYQWNHQQANRDKVAAILKANGRRLTTVYASTFQGRGFYLNPQHRPNLVTFVALGRDFVWHKYEGNVAGGGRNTVYANGHHMKLTEFLALTPAKRRALFSTRG